MLRQTLSLILVALLIQAPLVTPVTAKTKEEKTQQHAVKVRNMIAKLGTGESARVEVKLRDKTKLKGYIREAGAGSFVIVDSKTGAATAVAYPQVKQAKGNNLSTGAKIAIGLGLAAAVIIFLALLFDE
jgi:sulfate adenylyltransferase subunit 1 (EFTu-like GTPase family)